MHTFLYTQILEIWSAESLYTSSAADWWHSYAFHECQWYSSERSSQNNWLLKHTASNTLPCTVSRGFLMYWSAKDYLLDVSAFIRPFTGKNYFPGGVLLLFQIVHRGGSQQFSNWAENFFLAKKQYLPEEYWRISALKLCRNCLFLTIIFLHSVLHCNDSCIQYYLCFFFVIHKWLCN